jgi:hypothetical protein
MTSSILKTSSNYKYNINTLETPRTKIEFSTTTLVAIGDADRYDTHIRYKISNHNSNRHTALPARSMIKSRKWHRVICEYERREEDRSKKKQQQCNISTNNNNQYNILQNDMLGEYGRYKEPWSLDSAASGNYCGKKTKIKNRKTISNGIQVGVANNQSMIQIEEGELPFDRLPNAANDVQVFPTMQGPLIVCGKLATNGCGIWFDNENGSVVSGTTKDKINRTSAMVPLAAPLFGVLFLRGHISLKNRSYRPLLRASTSPFKSTSLLIRLKEPPLALYLRYKYWQVPF